MKFPLLLCLLLGFGSPGLGGEFYQQYSSSIATNRDTYVPLDEYPFLVDTNNNGAKLTNAAVNLKDMKAHGEISGVRLGMTMDEAIARWGKPRSGYAPLGCLHRLATFFYEDAALAFETNCLETIEIPPRAKVKVFDGPSSLVRSDDFLRVLGSPTSRLMAGSSCSLVYLSPAASLRLDFYKDELVAIYLEHTQSRAEPWKQTQEANLRSALDARTALCFHIERHWPGASESDRWAVQFVPVAYVQEIHRE